MRRLIWVLLLCFFAQVRASDHFVSVLDENAYQSILQASHTQPFLIVFWSLDCPPCIEELATLRRFHRDYPQKKIIFISIDSVQQIAEIETLMEQYGLQNLQQWVFSENKRRLRYSIDPSWYGEVPRSYFYLPSHPGRAFSGRLSYSQLTGWFNMAEN